MRSVKKKVTQVKPNRELIKYFRKRRFYTQINNFTLNLHNCVGIYFKTYFIDSAKVPKNYESFENIFFYIKFIVKSGQEDQNRSN